MDWGLFASAFSLVFIAELGDKTQLAVLAQVCKYRRPWAVFLGAALALTVVTALGAVGGQVLGQLLPESLLRIGAAGAFVVMGALLVREALRADGEKDPEGLPACEEELPARSAWDWRAFSSTFGLLFLAELGDKTQLTVLSLASQCRTPWAVFLGGALALIGATAIGAAGGEGLSRFLPRRLLLGGSASLFILMGLLIGAGLI